MAKIAIDLGCSGIRLYIQNKDLTVKEPAVAALRLSDSGVCAVGDAANRVFAKTPGAAQKLLPLADDYISNFDAVTAILRKYLKYTKKDPPELLLSVGNHISENEKKLITGTLTEKFGCRTVDFVPTVYASALGCRIPYGDGKYRMTAELCTYSMNIVIMKGFEALGFYCVRKGSSAFDLAVFETLHDRFGIRISDAVAGMIKKDMVSLEDGGSGKTAEISGISTDLGLPRTVTVSSGDFSEYIRPAADTMIRTLKTAASRLSPEAWRDVCGEGILLTGGAVIDGFAQRVRTVTGMNVRIAEDAEGRVIAGMKKMLDESIPVPHTGRHMGVLTSIPARGSERYEPVDGDISAARRF